MNNSSPQEIEGHDPPNPPPDKFKIPLPRCKSAFKVVTQKLQDDEGSGNKSSNGANMLRHKVSIYEYIIRKVLSGATDITPNEKMILRNHPVIVELINQTKQKNFCSIYIPIEKIINYEYFHAAVNPVLNDSREKWSLEEQVVQFVAPQDEENSNDSTKCYSFDSMVPEEDLTKIIGKYTLIERRERIKKYKMKLKKYKLGSMDSSSKYHKRSIIAKAKPRFRGKFAKTSPSTKMTETH